LNKRNTIAYYEIDELRGNIWYNFNYVQNIEDEDKNEIKIKTFYKILLEKLKVANDSGILIFLWDN